MSRMDIPSRGISARAAMNSFAAAEQEWQSFATGEHPVATAQVHATRVQALCTAAMAHAILELGDILRTMQTRSSDV